MPRISTEVMREIAEELQGTCGSLDDKLKERGFMLDDVPAVLLRDFDEEVMMCETCNWWCDPYELDDNGNCEDCREEPSEDEAG